jgi:hypothetical protein
VRYFVLLLIALKLHALEVGDYVIGTQEPGNIPVGQIALVTEVHSTWAVTTLANISLNKEGVNWEIYNDSDYDNYSPGELHQDSGQYEGYALVQAKTPLNSGATVYIVIKYSFLLELPIGEPLPDERLRVGANRRNTTFEVVQVYADPSSFKYGGVIYKFHSVTIPTSGQFYELNQNTLSDYSTNPIYYPHVGEQKLLYVNLNYSATYDGNTYEYHTESYAGTLSWYQSEL